MDLMTQPPLAPTLTAPGDHAIPQGSKPGQLFPNPRAVAIVRLFLSWNNPALIPAAALPLI